METRKSRLALSVLLLVLGAAAARATSLSASDLSSRKVNINTASAEQLAYLPRIGEKMAARIVEYRRTYGPFPRPEELMEVKGIGEKLFLTLKPYLTVSGPTTLKEKIRLASSRRRDRATDSVSPGRPR